MKQVFDLKYLSLCVLLVLTALSYHPRYSSFVTDSDAVNPLNRYIYLMTVITLIIYLFKLRWRNNVFVVTFFKCLIVITAVGSLLMLSGLTSDYFTEARNILMAFVFLLLGYNSNLSRNQYVALIIIYAITVSYCVFNQIISNFGGFVIAEVYLQYGKNTLGVITASSCVSLLIVALHSDRSFVKFVGWGLFLVLLFFTVTIRARAAFLTVFLLSAYIIYRKLKDNNVNISRILGLLLLALLLLLLASIFTNRVSNVWDYIYNSFTLNQGEDLTSGRMYRNIFALHLIGEAPLFGNLTLGYQYEWIHNYVLRQTSSFGLLGSLPLNILYFYIFVFMIKRVRNCKLCIDNIGFIVFLIPLIISLEEPTFPFAPGTGVILPFVLLGISLACQNDLTV